MYWISVNQMKKYEFKSFIRLHFTADQKIWSIWSGIDLKCLKKIKVAIFYEVYFQFDLK